MTSMTRITIVAPCFNESDNIDEFYLRVSATVAKLPEFNFDFIIIDNNSTDGTFDKLKALAAKDKRLKLIRNMRNFGQNRSPYHAMMQSTGDATVCLASDLQDPPELILDFIEKWKNGSTIVLGTKPTASYFSILNYIRKFYYSTLNFVSGVDLVNNATGFGIYDKSVIDVIRNIGDPNPYFRGLICELGFPIDTIQFLQPRRSRGLSKNNIYSLFDFAMLGFTNHSKIPLRLATFFGFFIGLFSLIASLVMFGLKIIYWDKFAAGIAPLMIIFFILFGAIMIFIGILGEYVSAIHSYVQKRPVVIEKERINF